jgi:prevent-host-death family protein
MRVTSVELHQKLGQTIDRARIEPVVVTKHDRAHVVIMSAEHYAYLQQVGRRARLTGSLSPDERARAAAADVPSKAEQKRYLAELAAAMATEPQS